MKNLKLLMRFNGLADDNSFKENQSASINAPRITCATWNPLHRAHCSARNHILQCACNARFRTILLAGAKSAVLFQITRSNVFALQASLLSSLRSLRRSLTRSCRCPHHLQRSPSPMERRLSRPSPVRCHFCRHVLLKCATQIPSTLSEVGCCGWAQLRA